MPDIYTYWDSSENAPANQADLMRLWERSWSARGWNPRILTVRNAQKHKSFKHTHPDGYHEIALVAAGGGVYADVHEINFSFPPASKPKTIKGTFTKIHGTTYHSLHWKTAQVVNFENCHPDIIMGCGRAI